MVEYVTIKLPKIIVTELVDPRVNSEKYASRSDVVKSALRAFAKTEA